MSKLFGNFIGFILLISFLYGQEAQTVTATGFGAILGGDKVKANEDATNDALRKAVEQVVEAATKVDEPSHFSFGLIPPGIHI